MTDAAPPPILPSQTARGPGFRFGPAGKIGLIGLLLLLMLIPLMLIRGVIEDREQYQEQALAGFRAAWGPAQSVLGPILIVPYLSGTGTHQHREYLHIAADRLSVTAEIQPETRQRGLFHAVVFSAEAKLNGQFLVPPDALTELPELQRVLWSEAYILLGATDLRALKNDAALDWGGRRLSLSDAAEHNSACGNLFLLAAHPGLDGPPPADTPIPFATTLDLRGTGALRIVPIGRQIDVAMAGGWATPSFGGEIPPADHLISDQRFSANWHVASNAATGRWFWQSASRADCSNGSYEAVLPEGQLGVELLEAVPTYRMVDRSSKYGVLFLVLSFLTYFLFETIARIRIHIVQYGLLGLSISLFALLLISFAEPMGFTAAYVLSSAAVMAQASVFTASVTGKRKLALVFALVLAGLFGFLYVVLSLESLALLAGTVALFALLSAIMALTHKIDWSGGKPVSREAKP
jgi:inner membrane protein